MVDYVEYLKHAILHSYKEFQDNGFANPGFLENWMTMGVFYLYSHGLSYKFASEHTKFLEENFEKNKDAVLKFIVSNYVQEISEKPEDELVGSFQKAVRKTGEEKSLEEVTEAIQNFIKENDTSMFVEVEEDDFKRYSQEELVKIMCASTVKSVIEQSTVDIADLKPLGDEKKSIFTEAEFAVVANSGEKDIDRVVAAMEAIRSGKINNQYIKRGITENKGEISLD